MYATRARDHDALWYLQMTKVTTDTDVAKKRGKRTIRSRGPLSSTWPPPPDPDEAAAAVRAVHRIAAQMGLDDAARREALEALGLAEQAKPADPWTPAIAVPARAAGICRTCLRSVYLRKNGTVMNHSENAHLPAGDSPCPGSKTLPRSEATR